MVFIHSFSLESLVWILFHPAVNGSDGGIGWRPRRFFQIYFVLGSGIWLEAFDVRLVVLILVGDLCGLSGTI